jgi:hypothetical protein
MPCSSLSIGCYATDRISGRTEDRGHIVELEREREEMAARLRSMGKLLEVKGVHIWPLQSPPPLELQWTPFCTIWVKDVGADPGIIADPRLGGIANGAPFPDVGCRPPGVPDNTLLPLEILAEISRSTPPATQFASPQQPNLNMAVGQGRFGSRVHTSPPPSPPSQPESTTLNPTVTGTEKAPYDNHSMASTTPHPPMGYSPGFTQSTFTPPSTTAYPHVTASTYEHMGHPPGFTQSTYPPGSTPGSVQSSHTMESPNNYFYATPAEAPAAAAQMNSTVHTLPRISPQVTAAHNQVVAYNPPQQTEAVLPYHHQTPHHYQHHPQHPYQHPYQHQYQQPYQHPYQHPYQQQ